MERCRTNMVHKSQWMMLSVCSVMFAILNKVAGQDQRGTEFMLSFIDLPKRQGNPLLFISAELGAVVNITIPLLQRNLTRTLEPGQSWKETLPRELRYNAYFTSTPSAVYVASTSPVSVYVYDGYRNKASGYMALPFHALSTSYIAVTHGRRHDVDAAPVMLIVAIMDQTNVDVYYKLPSGEGCDVHGNGGTSNHVLDAYDVYGMTCSGDFTGTRIVSDKPIVVISGHQDDAVSADRTRDTLQEMLIPEDYFGLSYVLIKHGSKGTINRIVSASNNTQVLFSNGSSFDLNAFEYMDIDTDHTGQQCISSNNPVLAVAFGKTSNRETFGDASMCILTANNMFTTSMFLDYGVTDILGVSEYVYVATVVDRADLGAGVVAAGVSREVIPGCQYDVLTRKVENWPLSYSDGTLEFGSYLYGSNEDKYNGIAFPLNMNFVWEASSTTSLTETTSTSLPSSTLFPSSSYEISAFMTSITTVSESFPQTTTAESRELASASSSAMTTPSTTTSAFDFGASSPAEPVTSTSFITSSSSSELKSTSGYEHITNGPETFSTLSPTRVTLQTDLTSMTDSVTAITVTSAAVVDVPQVCGCPCENHAPWNITEERLEMLRKDIHAMLRLETKNLSKTIRKRTSAQDNTPSAVTIGSVGIAFIVFTVLLMLVPDVISGLIYLFSEAQHQPKVLQVVRKVK
ncbi:uncharacterized protein LOC124282991 [Haliotis rubra]|uniref:uncharacterized protein LOC124282991 n=1 Tax=Haliotis rubra TaxID=36100 RepID=UPI001EE5FDBA|nr:uncharacterized protein LOC124282991 [Haliotis rubra]